MGRGSTVAVAEAHGFRPAQVPENIPPVPDGKPEKLAAADTFRWDS